MTDNPIPAVVYGVKSSPDEKESVADQQRIVREALERAGGRHIIGVFGEAKQSGYRKERGPQLEAAMRAAIDVATEGQEAELWVWHSSRLARGDGTKGKRSIQKIVSDLLYEGVTVRSATDPEMVTPMLAGIASTVSNKYSSDLSTWTRTGLERRRKRGAPIGALPFGYMVGYQIVDGRVTSRRGVDDKLAASVEEIFERVASGASLGSVARWLNAQGVKTRRGTAFVARSVRKIVENEAYEGQKGYPQIVTPERAQEARAAVMRLDPSAVQRRKGGRPSSAYLLRSIAFCAGCGAPLYTSRKYLNGRRGYVCSNKLQSTGLCDRPGIPADVLEKHVLNHLNSFIGSVEAWITERLSERSIEVSARQRQLDIEKAQLATLDARRKQRMAEIAEHGITSPIAAEVIDLIDSQREAQAQRIEEAEAVVAEHSGTPDVDAALEFYERLVEAVQDRVRQATEVGTLNEALASVLAGLWCELEKDRERLLVQFALRTPTVATLPDGSAAPAERLWLPPARLGYQPIEPLRVSQTGQQTTVSAWRP